MGTLGISQVTTTAAQQPVQQAVKVVRGSYLDEKIAEEEILRMTGKEKLSDLIHNDDSHIKKNIKNNKTSNQKKNTQKLIQITMLQRKQSLLCSKTLH